jgi:hypothetical protein
VEGPQKKEVKALVTSLMEIVDVTAVLFFTSIESVVDRKTLP